ncbi:MAG: hypothetical protein AABX48_03190 [Nanoarchaeota archaeon]
MNTLEKPASDGQTLEDFRKMMEKLKPYLPPRRGILELKPLPYEPSETLPKRRFEY